MIPKVYPPAARRMITLEVRRREVLSPGFVSVTLGGPGLRDFVPAGNDQAVRLFFPRAGQTGLRMPTASNEAWMAQVLLMPKSVRPWVRNLTIRRARPADDEVDIEFAVHGDSPMSSWARRAEPGSPAGIFDIGTTYGRPAHTEEQLLIGDESALPAILSILDGTPPSVPTRVLLEVPSRADVRAVDAHWLVRDGTDPRPGVLALDAIRAAALPSRPFYTWVAGESRLVTGVRRHLVNDRGVPRQDISFIGYWRLGRSAPG